ncbi:GatB/YqeY domain-containing protein [Marinihelvus fidelis]|uniref:GatB/YqeY domain-containing protein n=1 Tax=Marinihelvus fidelis TaxID=2613842 RepID=A0A5N0T8N2_9GAMM|nr:GatB/YqeY domain-containing protein [Marinihelvus fidelis]KAA9131300.1 GatB/YqeY domain-containing protein [Marinihelvus fidelis]
MSLKTRISEDVKQAMRARDKSRLSVLRQISAAIKQIEVDERIVLDDAGVTAVLDKMAKQRRESLEQYTSAGRDDLAAQERFELEILGEFLPEPLSEEELAALIDDAVTSSGASGMQDMGRVMGELKPHVQGRADMKAVSAAVRARLNA